MKKTSTTVLAITAGILLTSGVAKADTLVVPNVADTTPGNGGQFLDSVDSRAQNIYDASQFLTAMPNGGEITEIAFRLNENFRSSVSTVIPALEIRMSTSPAAPPNISTFFSANTGNDDTLVFPTQSVKVFARGSTGAPTPFDIRLPLSTAFHYDPRRGSLLIDIFLHGANETGLQLDTSTIGSAAIGGPIGIDKGVNTVTALVAQITFTPLPEPSSLKILLLAGATLLCFGRRLCR